MRVSLRQWQIFSTIADTGTTQAAGQRIGLSQSAVSAALTELESSLGQALFDRIGRRLLLNSYGQALLPQARALLAAATELERGGTTASVRWRIGASTTIGNYLLPPRLLRLRATHPQIRVDLIIGNTQHIIRAVQRLEVDIGLIEGSCHTTELKTQLWQYDELVIVYGRTYCQAEKLNTGASMQQLQQACWLLRESGSGTGEALMRMLLPHVHSLDDVWQLGSTEAIKQCAIAGLGLACLSRHTVADALESGKLLTTSLPPLRRPLWILQHPGRTIDLNLQQLLA